MSERLSGHPYELAYRMPAEWAHHLATWMSWPFDEEMWHGHLEEVRLEYAELVRTLCRAEPVHLLLRDAEARSSALKHLASCPQLTLHDVPLNDVWLRDNGPIFISRGSDGKNDGRPTHSFVNWEFNSWGQKYEWDLDNQAPLAIGKALGMPFFEAKVVMEGGSLEVNGRGMCLTTEQCLLSPFRNPNLSREQIEEYLLQYLGLDQIVWLKRGLEGDHTDGHIDTITRFVSSHTILSSICLDRTDANYLSMQENLETLQRIQSKDGLPLRIIPLPLPERRMELADGTRLPPTYANFYIANGLVVVPQYGDPQDKPALEIIQSVFPDRKVIGLDSRFIITGGGSFHCLTQQQSVL